MRTLTATPVPGPTTIATRWQPSTTCRAVSHTPALEMENAVPAAGPAWTGTSTTTDGSKGEAGPRASPNGSELLGGGGGASVRSSRPSAANSRATTMAA